MKHKQTLRRGLSVLLALVLCLSLLPATALAEETETSVEINETNFPDETFRTVAAKYDKDSDGALNAEEIQNATYMSCSEKDIASLEGIEYFTELTSLICNKNQLTELDISNNKKLVWLDCSNNQLTKLDFSNNTDLMRLYCNDNSLTSLDVSNNKKLMRFYCGGNSLTSLDLSENTKLEDFLCIGNEWYRITLGEDRSFDLSTLPGKFDVGRARDWSSGSVSGNILTVKSGVNSVTYTYDTGLEGNSVTCTLFWGIDINEENFPDANFRKYVLNRLDSNKNSLLEDSEIANAETFINLDGQYSTEESKITSLKGIEYFTELQYLYCSYNKLTELDLSKNTKLRTLKCNFNQLTKLDLSKNTELVWLEASANPQLGSLDITNSLNLDHLYVQAANLTELDVSQYTELEVLYCTHNQLTKLDVSQNKKLLELKCGENPLTTLNVSNNTALTSLDCHNCQLTSLDLSNNTALTTLDLFNNYYTIGVDETRTFDLNNLKQYGFDLSKVVSWTNGTVNTDGILTVASGATTVTYSYNCREDCDRDFHLEVVPKYTVAFNANGGSGTMAPASANKGSSYTLPECGFIAPEGKQFKAWSVDGTEYAVGASITVKANTTVTAVWEEIPVSTYDQTADFTSSGNIPEALTLLGGDSKAAWNGETNTLTLNGVNFTTSAATAVKLPAGAVIDLVGKNTITSVYQDLNESYGIYAEDGLTIQGGGTLTVTGGESTGLYNVSFGIYADDGDVTISGGTVIATGGTAGQYSCGIYALSGDVRISGESTVVTATGGWSSGASSGISGVNITVLSGTVTALGGTAGSLGVSQSCGISADCNVTISGGTVVATGGEADNGDDPYGTANSQSYGISGNRNITISGESVTATGGDADDQSCGISGGSITISGKKVIARTLAGDEAKTRMALNKAPDLSTYVSYDWRTGSEDSFKLSADEAYTYSESDTYVEFSNGNAVTTYTVTFDANGGSGSMDAVTVTSGDYTLPDCKFTAPDGKQFKAWSVNGTEYAVGAGITVSADTTLYAVWEDIPAVTYTVTFDANGGELNTGSWRTTETEADGTVDYLAAATREGYTFDGWYTAATGGEKVYTYVTVFTADTTVYAHWTPEAQTKQITAASFAMTGYTVGAKAEDIVITSNTEGLSLIGGYFEALGKPYSYLLCEASDGDLNNVTEVTGSLEAGKAYILLVKADINAGYETSALTADAVTLNSTIKAFDCDADVIGEACASFVFILPALTEDDTPDEKHTVTFAANGGSGEMSAVTGVSGSYTLPECGFTAPEGKRFKAWSVNGTEYAAGAGITVSADTTVTAVWEDIPVTTYTVTFAANGGSGEMSAVTGVSGSYTLPACEFTAPEGKQFKAWSVNGTEYAVGAGITVSADTTVTAVWEDVSTPPATEYTITFDGNGGTPSVTSVTTVGKKLASLPTATRSGYTLDGWYTAADGGEKVTTDTEFEQDTTLYAHWTKNSSGSGGSSAPTYVPSVTQPENGAVTVSPKAPKKDDTVTITPKPETGYTVEQILVTDKNGDPVEVTNNGDGTFSFTQPAGKVTVEVTFMEDNSMLNFFVDVPAGAYYYDAVLWAAENGITGGVDDTHFAPNSPCTRAQIVTFLWRAAGFPEPKTVSSFADVSADSYYAKAVAWAVENGITKGTSDTTFSPDATCTRAQIVTFLWRAQKTPAAGTGNPFTDVAADAYYADAVLWAVENGVTNGTSDTTFSPNSDCTRAQIVTFLFRCLG